MRCRLSWRGISVSETRTTRSRGSDIGSHSTASATSATTTKYYDSREWNEHIHVQSNYLGKTTILVVNITENNT